MLGLVTLWCCGVYAITRKGKIGYFILKFFDRKKQVRENFNEVANMNYDAELRAHLAHTHRPAEIEDADEVENFMDLHSIFSELDSEELLRRIASPNDFNEYFYMKDVPVFPSYIKDPIIGCVTCMASLHSLVVYTAFTVLLDFYWNPFEWISLAIPAAFINEFLYIIKNHFDD
jgi:hypothetical protein